MKFLSDFWGLLKERKKFWLLPALIILVVVGTVIIIGASTVVAPFIYTVF